MTQRQLQRWYPALAGYRALAALAVFVFHIASIDPPGGIVGRWTTPLGNAAVSLFFVLSGFLIYRPFAEWALNDGEEVPGVRFMIRRAARILPLYWVVLTVHLFVVREEGLPTFDEAVTAYALIQNFRGSLVFVPPFVAWSLCIELWFSFALPLAAGVLRRLGGRRSPRNRLAVQLFGLGFMATAAIVFRIWALGGPDDSGRILWVPAYLDWFAGGLVLAVLTTHWHRVGPPITVRRIAAHPWILGLIGLVAYWTVTQIGLPGSFIAPTPFQTHAQFLLEGLASTTLVAAAVLPNADLGRAGTILASRVLEFLGALSFGIYLVHPVVTDTLLVHWPAMPMLVLALVALVLTIAISWVLHRVVEQPASALADRRLRARRRPDRATDEVVDDSPVEFTPRRAVDSTTMPIAEDGSEAVVRLFGPGLLALVLICLSGVATLLSRPGIFIADARYELFADPASRLQRLGMLWDASRDLGRPAEEFWPGMTLLAGFFHLLAAPPWLNERLVHAVLLSLASCGAMLLSRAVGEERSYASLLVGLLYGFGPFSAVYLVPSPLYVSHALAPWMVLAVLSAARGRHTFAAAGSVALALFAVGNADPPGLLLALVPAVLTWVGLIVVRRDVRRRLTVFASIAFVTTLAISSAMIVKTSTGAAALAHRLFETETPEVIAATSSFTESLRGMGFWLTYLRIGPTQFRLQHEAFVGDAMTIMVTFVPLIVGISMLARQRARCRLLALSWVIVGAVLMAGMHPVDDPTPYGRLLRWSFDNYDIAYGFRSTHKAGVVLALGVAVLGGWGIADVIDLARRRGTRWYVSSVVLTVSVLGVLTHPFWASDLYDTAATSKELPDHWTATEAWYLDHPPEGRVLVLPGTTNTAYRWGSVGDDLLDPIIPHRVVASTLPLSSSLAADLVQAMNDALVDPHYRAGTARAMARRLGVTDIVIRNDLDWERQSIARPSDLAPLRSDPDLELVAAFGPQGLYSSRPLAAPPVEGEELLAPVEVYRIRDTSAPTLRTIDADQQPMITIVDGDGSAVANLAALGALDDQRPIAFAGELDHELLEAIAGDVARIVMTDTNLEVDRRINYYGYEFAELPSDATPDDGAQNGWLGDRARGAVSQTDREGFSVGSSVDRWLLGLDHAPGAATDGDPNSWWSVPPLARDRPARWWIEWSAPTEVGTITIDLQDLGGRIGTVQVLADDAVVVDDADAARSGQIAITDAGSIQRLEIVLSDFGSGIEPIGLVDVAIDGLTLRPMIQLSSHMTDLLIDDPPLQSEMASASLAIVVGALEPTDQPIVRSFDLWRSDSFDLTGSITGGSLTRCRSDVVEVDGEAVPVLLSAGGEGDGLLRLCGDRLELEPGRHVVAITPPPGVALSLMVLATDEIDSSAVESRSIEAGESISLDEGDYLLGPASFDQRWSFDGGSRTTALALDGQIAWRAMATVDAARAPTFAPEPRLSVAWAITLVGGVLALLLVAVADRSLRASAPVASGPPSHTYRAGSAGRILTFATGVVLAGTVGGVAGIVGALIAVAICRWFDVRTVFALAAVAMAVVAITTALPVLGSDRAVIDPTADDSLSRAAIGALVVGLLVALQRQLSATDELDDAVPGSELA